MTNSPLPITRERRALDRIRAGLGDTLPAYLVGRLGDRIAADPDATDLSIDRDLLALGAAVLRRQGTHRDNHPGPLFADPMTKTPDRKDPPA